MEPTYIVFVMPPSDVDEKPFDIPEWSYSSACDIARRYRARGWRACIIDADAERRMWHVRGLDLPTLHVPARSADEALMLARAVDKHYYSVQLRS